MLEFLYSIDKAVFQFCNQTIANPAFDAAMPFITDLNQHWYGLVLFGGLWMLLFWRGGKKGRTVALLLIPLITISDQLSSAVIKNIVARPRPCHTVNGLQVLQDIRELVPCGSGFSFPSSHAVNNFAAATFLSNFYRRWSWAFYSYASVMAFSRLSVGVHYPSDVVGGAMIGAATSVTVLYCWRALEDRFPLLSVSEPLSQITPPHE
jgi:undecaprenyl-diphosphatase